jgi:O-antigen/teichoic acid export membrane protein
MAEYLARGENGVARAIYDKTLSLQVMAALLLTGASELFLLLAGDPQYRVVSMIQVLAVLPGMINAVPSQANNAAEDMRANVASSILSSVIYLIGVVASLYFHWDLFGIAIGFALSRFVEMTIRLVQVTRRVHTYPKGRIPQEVRPGMRTFALNSLMLMLINVVVWDKSDIILLNYLNTDIDQISYFALTFNIIEKMVLIPQVFGHALGVTMMADYGRDPSRVALIARSAAKYMYLFAAPPLFGLALMSGPLVLAVYREQYRKMIPVLAVASALALFKPLLLPIQYFFRAHSRQTPLIVWNSVCGVLNVAIDWTLIPRLGALGASIGNGVAQASAVLGIWAFAIWTGGLSLDFPALAKITMALLAMAPPVLFLNSILPPVVALFVSIPVGAVVFLGLIRLTSVLNLEDCERLNHVSGSLPARIRPGFQRLVRLMVPAAREAARSAHSA